MTTTAAPTLAPALPLTDAQLTVSPGQDDGWIVTALVRERLS